MDDIEWLYMLDRTIDWEAALTSWATTLLEQDMEPIAPGDVVLLSVPAPAPVAPDGTCGRHVAVVRSLHVHDDRTWLNVVLAHATPEMATDHDVVLFDVTPYPLVLMGELYAQAWATQVERIVAHAPLAAVQAAWAAVSTDGMSVEPYNRALPLAGPADPRWTWIEQWLPCATAIASPVRRTLLG